MLRHQPFYKLYYFILLVLLILIGGTVGYTLIEGWDVIDAFYMTIITVSTVGFEEVEALSTYGKLFTAFLIMSSFGIFAFAITSITTYIVGGEYKQYLKHYRLMQQRTKMNDHIIICGFGRVGRQVAEDLLANGDDFVIIDDNEEIVEKATEEGFNMIKGDSTNDEVLQSAYIERARGVITCLPKDAENLYVVLSARESQSSATIITRASNPSAVSKLKLAGANNVIMPNSVGGSHMASLIANPDVIEFLDIVRVTGYQGANVESITFDQFPEEFRYKTVEELETRRITGVTIIGFKSAEGEYVINPPLETKLVEGAKIFVLGNAEQIKTLKEYFQLRN